ARGIVVRNKARLVAQGHRQEEGIDYDEVFALVARIEVIHLFLAFASYMGFMVYQMDIKSTFLYGEIKEEVYLTQPKGFEDPHIPKHVYRVVKALYGFHQAHRTWYARLSTFLLKHHYKRGEFEMCAMGELPFFLGLQVKQLPDGIFISQDKYVKDMLKKFDMESVGTTTTPYEVSKHKSKDDPNAAVNVYLFRSMSGALMYLTASRPDIMFAVYGTLKILLFSWKLTVIVTMLGLIVIGNSLLVDANFWVEGSLDPKPNVRLWVQLHEHQDLY
nr:putative ribonuclease H-like domain-containing protein [Tanacetum cinerariifolium]